MALGVFAYGSISVCWRSEGRVWVETLLMSDLVFGASQFVAIGFMGHASAMTTIDALAT